VENNTYIIERANKIIKICENASRDSFITDYLNKITFFLKENITEGNLNKKNILQGIKLAKKILSLNDSIVDEKLTLNVSLDDIISINNISDLKIIDKEIETETLMVNKLEDIEKKPTNILVIEEEISITDNNLEFDYNTLEDKTEIDFKIDNKIYLKIYEAISTAIIYKVEVKNITFNYILGVTHLNYIYKEFKTHAIEQLNKFFSLLLELLLLPLSIQDLENKKKKILEEVTSNNSYIKQDIKRSLLSIESNLDSHNIHKDHLIEEINFFINIKKLLKSKRKINHNSYLKYLFISSFTLNLYMLYLINNYIFILTNQY